MLLTFNSPVLGFDASVDLSLAGLTLSSSSLVPESNGSVFN